jgi:tetratricopeptide (TPR) repeat protein
MCRPNQGVDFVKQILLFFAVAAILCGCSRQDETAYKGDSYIFPPIVAASAHIAVVEKPDARNALLIGDVAKRLEPYLMRSGVKCHLLPEGKFDLIAVACSEMSEKSCGKLTRYLSENGIVVWLMDVEGVSASSFRRRLSAFNFTQVHLWMPGETRWILVGRRSPREIKLSAMLEYYSRESVFEDFAFSRCTSLQEIFANYAGERESIMPAFGRGDMSAAVKPEFFLERNVSNVKWISREGVDKDIAAEVFAKIREMQKVRREVVEGNIMSALAKDRKSESAATDIWSKAAEKNPNDLFLLERLDRLERNAKGFMEVKKVLMAMKCYETMALIRPNDPVALYNFGMCLKEIGKLDVAQKVLDRAKQLGLEENLNAEHSSRPRAQRANGNADEQEKKE